MANQTAKALLDVEQITGFGHPVRLRQRDAAGCLLKIDTAPHAGFGALADLRQPLLVQRVVFTRQGFHLTETLYVEIGAHGFLGDPVDDRHQFVVASQLLKTRLLDAVAGAHPIEEHLTQFQRPARTAPVLVSGAIRLITATFAAHPPLRVDLRKIVAAQHFLVFHRDTEIMVARPDFGVRHDAFFHHPGQ